ncbi:GatB/YqeY domain-containing protein [Texcoconibacillus texcoconensis]|uniref:GatB/YqeY domain-containing protein n=1 Tax=Texcoconibacillus texcoconensis TaxID=1095777 RepID=A0A840QRE8_9BACI|nr:GatB/YqeY domain-containing protein [Texcoconibacillus texcoconensis]MBB5173944.1 hypothetical protein [Texcoconibacillus texcoconensis]
MSLLERLNEDMKEAMKNKEKSRLSVIRQVKSSLQNEAIHLGHELTEEEVLTVLNREMKQRKESLQEYENANRDDLVKNVRAEMTVLEQYMPKPLTEDELLTIVQQTIEETGVSSKAGMGDVMAAIMPKVKGRADGSLVKRLVQQELSKL